MGLRGVVKKQIKKAVKGLGNQLPGYGELNLDKNRKLKTNAAGNAIRGKGKK